VRLLATGAGVGLIGAFVIARAMAGILVGVSPADPATLAAATATLMAIGLLGCYVPVRRALRVDPIVTLRSS
jgi:putative ABC transport system permease protein